MSDTNQKNLWCFEKLKDLRTRIDAYLQCSPDAYDPDADYDHGLFMISEHATEAVSKVFEDPDDYRKHI